jgi:uncharacterized SAM-binding protein YcdF (DUF218 family)
MNGLEAFGLYFLSPLTLALAAALAAGVLRFANWRRSATALAGLAFAILWLGSTPWIADALASHLERQYRAMAPQDAPVADAIVVLGGAVAGARPPERPTLSLLPSSTRVWYAAALYRAGKARWVVVAAGNRPEHADEQVEADAIQEMLVQLGVPASAIVLERSSRTTRENAANVLPELKRRGVRSVLLVTSAIHMPRALQTFVRSWGPDAPKVLPAVTDVRSPAAGSTPLQLWLPSLDALISVTRALKELAGMAVFAIIP